MRITTTLLASGVCVAPAQWYTQGIPRPYRLYYIKSGTAYYRISEEVFTMKRSCFYLFPSSLPVQLWQNPQDRIDHMYFDFISSQPIIASEPVCCMPEDHALLPGLLTLMEAAAKDHLHNPCPETKKIAASLLEAFLTILFCIKPLEMSQSNDILRTIEYMETHYMENITIEEIASMVYLNVDYFIRKFKKEMGITPYAYLSRLRKSIASTLIASGVTQKEAAEAVGYEHAASLCNALKTHTGKDKN